MRSMCYINILIRYYIILIYKCYKLYICYNTNYITLNMCYTLNIYTKHIC